MSLKNSSAKESNNQLFQFKNKKASQKNLKGFFNKYGSYLLSRIVVQYHRP